ncbi:MAG TPA: amidohydrolase family protein [Candidatus Acidoferrales bacterium]|nr:amidohydrolase family protein [Candidatus Acidoferrales bacterium]
MAKNGFRVFDSDMHVMEPPDLWERYIAPEFRALAPRGVTSENVRDLRISFPQPDAEKRPYATTARKGRNYARNQALYRDHAARGWSGEVQLEAMNTEGIDVAVMFPSRGLNALVGPDGGARVSDPRFAAAIARAYNDWLADFCKADPQRMLGAGMISVYDIRDAVEETRRVVQDLGFKAVFLRSNIVNEKPWHDRYYEPLWDTLERLDIPLGLHQATASSVPQLTKPWFGSPSGLQRAYGQPVGQMLAVGSFLGGGVLERHPALRVAFLEANCSWLPWLLWRLDEAYELEGDLDMPELAMPPSAYFKRQCVASVEPDEAPARYAIDFLGNDNLVYSTDYPHGDSRYPRATESFLKLPLADEDKRKILWDNCARFYGVGETTTAGARVLTRAGAHPLR